MRGFAFVPLGLASVVAALFVAAPEAAATGAQSTFGWTSTSDGPEYYAFYLDAPTAAAGDATLTINVSGDFDDASEQLIISLNGDPYAVLFDGAGEGEFCSPDRKTVIVSIPQATIAPLLGDGEVKLGLEITGSVEADCEMDYGTYSVALDGSLYVPGGEEELTPVEETTTVASSMTQSRSTVTISSLPSLSGRMSGGAPGGGGGVGGGGVGGAGGITGGGSSTQGSFSISGDFASLRRRAAAEEVARRFAAMGERQTIAAVASLDGGEPGATAAAPRQETSSFDIWFGGSFSYFDVELGGVGQTGGVGTAQMGVDTRLSRRVLVGAAVFGDLLQSDVSTGSTSNGLGVMAGPYAVVELDYGFYLELLAANGVAFNRIESDGLRDARYQSYRQLYTSRISGEWSAGDWLFRPSTRITYYAEHQESFDVGDGTIAPADLTELGQLRFGPEISYQLFWKDAALLPFVSAEGVWAFKQTDQSINGAVVAGEEITGSVSLGFDARLGKTTIRAGGRLDGIGEPRLDALTGELTIRAPF